MKYFFYLLIIVQSFQLVAQPVFSKDSVIVGDLQTLVGICASEMDNALGSIEMDTKSYCTCVMSQLYSNIHSSDIVKISTSDDPFSLILNAPGNKELFENCMSEQLGEELSKDFEINTDEIRKANGDHFLLGIRACERGMKNDPTVTAVLSDEDIEAYCLCSMNKLVQRGFDITELAQFEDEESEIYNEVIAECLVEVMENADFPKATPNPKSTVEGPVALHRVPIIPQPSQQGYRVKLTFGKVSRYFLIDSGASTLLIDREFERELLLAGQLSQDNYQGKVSYELADGTTVEGDHLFIPELKIGDYTAFNVEAGVLEDGDLLCGLSLLELFSSWEIQKEEKVLLLKK